jgi:hypothetical protein
MLGPLLVAQFWEVLESLGGGVSMEEIGTGGMPLKVIPDPQSSLLSLFLFAMR